MYRSLEVPIFVKIILSVMEHYNLTHLELLPSEANALRTRMKKVIRANNQKPKAEITDNIILTLVGLKVLEIDLFLSPFTYKKGENFYNLRNVLYDKEQLKEILNKLNVGIEVEEKKKGRWRIGRFVIKRLPKVRVSS